MSHPSRVCGLKYYLKYGKTADVYWSHPSRVCGLKSGDRKGRYMGIQKVAPFAGVWIEILLDEKRKWIDDGRTLRGCVD